MEENEVEAPSTCLTRIWIHNEHSVAILNNGYSKSHTTCYETLKLFHIFFTDNGIAVRRKASERGTGERSSASRVQQQWKPP